MGWRSGLPILFAVITLASGHAADLSAGAPGGMKRNESSVLWSRSIANRTPPPSRITVEGVDVDGRFVPQAVSIPDDDPKRTGKMLLPLGENLLDRFGSRPFGSEERVEAERLDNGLVIRCRAGTAPAGVVLETDAWHFPRAAQLKLVVAGHGSGAPFGLSVVERGADAPSPPQSPIGLQSASLQLPPSLEDLPSWDVVVNCPPGQGSFQLNAISLEPDRSPNSVSHTGTWLWNADAWLTQPRLVEEWAVTSRLDRIFLQLRIDNEEVSDAHALADFITRLGRRGISVQAVEGDPAMIAADGLDNARRRVAAIRRYQTANRPDARLSGLQFDIEPYLLPDFALDPAAVWGQWTAAIQSLSSAWGQPVSVVVPFWMLDSEPGKAAIASARTSVSDLTVMAYRTQTDEVIALSEPWLAWGAVHNLPISVALENGPLGIEVHRTFVRAETGQLQLSTEGGMAAVSLLSEPVRAGQDALAYAFHHETRVNPARISFMNNQDKLAVARAELARLLVAWLSFDGLMIHALGEADGGFGGPRIRLQEVRTNEPQTSDPDLRR